MFQKVSKSFKRNKGITLVELVMALAILGVTVSILYMVFFSNWRAYEDRIARANLWTEANEIMETMTMDGRVAHQINVSQQQDGSFVTTFVDTLDQPIATYVMTDDGRFQVARAQGEFRTISEYLVLERSSFIKDGESLNMTLALQDNVFGKPVGVQTAIEIYPRN